MDFKDINNRPTLLNKIDSLTNDLNLYLKGQVNRDDTYKKAALLYYWLRDYKAYMKNEYKFNSKYMPEFERGSIVNVNFGFNVGNEFGGLHYAVVLAKSSKTNNTLMVLPLKSHKDNRKPLHKTELALGTELYNRLLGKYTALKVSILDNIKKVNQANDELQKRIDLMQSLVADASPQSRSAWDALKAQADLEDAMLMKSLADLLEQSDNLDRIWNELSKLKKGSIAVVGQVKTISKMRVKSPTSTSDVLYGIKLSSENMQAIDDKIIEIYTNKH
jgi:hypothetical protein|nr:MAG TPA: endoribonuclease [Caudoviricetes sp.]